MSEVIDTIHFAKISGIEWLLALGAALGLLHTYKANAKKEPSE